MPQFSEASKLKLSSCAEPLQRLFNEVIKHADCRIEEGHRGELAQETAFRAGNSRLRFPNSKHNKYPSMAVDATPYPWRWSREKELIHFAGKVMGIAAAMGIRIRWGGDFDSDHDLHDQSFNDYPHFELVE